MFNFMLRYRFPFLLLFPFMFILVLNSTAQTAKKLDLSSFQLTENIDTLTKDIKNIKKELLFDQQNMLSYTFGNTKFEFAGYLPQNVDLLTYNGLLAGFAFKITSFEGQQKVASFLSQKYKGLDAGEANWETNYKYSNRRLALEMQSITEDQFKKGLNGYLSIKRADFAKAYDALVKKN
jgi:hypothetical protein